MSMRLKGMAWDHPRGYDPMVETSRAYEMRNPGMRITWDKRSLQDFEHFPLEQLTEEYDLIVIDHPHVGEAAKGGHLLALDEYAPGGALETLSSQSLSASYESYRYGGRQWALPIDAAAQVAAYRPDLLSKVPSRWSQVVDLAEAGKVIWPLTPVHALSSFFTLAANRGTPCAEDRNCLIDASSGRAVLQAMERVSRNVPSECLDMDPIGCLDWMSSEDAHTYCPLVYGYVNYARDGFRNHLVKFLDLPSLEENPPRGSTLGGTGIAVSSRSSNVAEAVDYAFWVASAGCQRGLYFESGGQPGNAGAWTDETLNAKSHDFFRDTRETLKRAWLRPRYEGYLRFQAEGAVIVSEFLAHRVGPNETLGRLQEAYRSSAQ